MKSDAQVADEFAALSQEEQQRVRGYQGIPLGSAVALHNQLQGLQKSQDALKDSIDATMRSVLVLLGEIRGELKSHDERIERLECRDREIEDRFGRIEGRIQAIGAQIGVAV